MPWDPYLLNVLRVKVQLAVHGCKVWQLFVLYNPGNHLLWLWSYEHSFASLLARFWIPCSPVRSADVLVACLIMPFSPLPEGAVCSQAKTEFCASAAMLSSAILFILWWNAIQSSMLFDVVYNQGLTTQPSSSWSKVHCINIFELCLYFICGSFS